ncbi:MAG TPA: zinc-binding dehydrogenase, partial [Acidimicrobiales bacterium]|nr:zinc-binding dehydrogenase [Acidimicrobiales bacterium]
PPLLPGFSLPHVAGMDVAGEIVETGTGVRSPAPGTRVVVKPGVHCGACPACTRGDDRRCAAIRVIGGSRWGGYADFCVVPASHVFELPDDVDFEGAACVPTALSTAWRAIVETGRVGPDDTVVVHGPGSAVSHFAVQLAKRAGATVVVTGRSMAKLERVRTLGADHVVSETEGSMVDVVFDLTDGRGADVVFNHVGSALFPASLAMLGLDGRLVVCGTTTGAKVELPLPRLYHAGLRVLGAGPQSYGSFIGMLESFWTGGLEAVVDSRFPLESAALAQERLESGETFGKILLVP